ncbi:MAG: glycosyltransferase family 1 protein [Pseudomonadota bacterium]|nr:glycosyltransferase family 1 protein [Pseudomonadota bacterium]
MKRILIDCRKILDGGIGTVIKNMLREFSDRFLTEAMLICNTLEQQDALKGLTQIPEVKKIRARPFSLLEQIELHRIGKNFSISLFPSLAHPAFLPSNKNYFIVHDVIQHEEFSSPFDRFVSGVFFKNIRRKGDGLIFPSYFSKQRFETLFGAAGEMKVCPLGVESAWVEAGSQNSGTDYLLYFGNCKHNKNVPFLIEGFLRSDLSDSRQLYIVGSDVDVDKRRLETLKGQYKNFHDRVRFVGEVSFDRLLSLVRSSFVVCCPSNYEGFGLPVLEAAASGKVVVHSNIPPFEEILGRSEYSFVSDDLSSLIRTLNKLDASNPGFQHERKRNHERALSFSWQNFAVAVETMVLGRSI